MKLFSFVGFLVGGILILTLFGIGAPLATPVTDLVSIQKGTSVTAVARMLKENNTIRFEAVFTVLVRIIGSNNGVIAGMYAVSHNENVISLAYRFSRGDSGLTSVKITIPEGSTNAQIADILSRELPLFDAGLFKANARPFEGFLFPDTYFFLPGITPDEVIEIMRETFNKKTAPLQSKIDAFGVSLKDAVSMASILEKEARLSETRRVVAGILWKRISINMPLQVDAVFGYILEKNGYAPTLDDLKIKSPYNTYLNRGLPPTPIGNPGLGAIEDAVTPTKTPYLYYLTAKDGVNYYGKTFAEHVANRVHLR